MPVDEYRDYVSATGELATAGIPEAEEDTGLLRRLLAELLAWTLMVGWRFRVMVKGAKPAKSHHPSWAIFTSLYALLTG